MKPIETKPLEPIPHKHKGPLDKPCATCGLGKDHTVHALEDPVPAPDPPPEGGGDYPPK